MAPIVLELDPLTPESDLIAQAANVLRAGRLVAFPTETVYGLGANALDETAVRRIFEAKGRPANNPVIVHVAEAGEARALVTEWPASAERLAERFWPGPLTLILPRNDRIPDAVTAGGPTVAVRSPAHPVALALIREAGFPIAAPSANRSSQLSPTQAGHVLAGLSEAIDLILDAGSTPGGIESTVLDLTTDPPCVLRPGLVTLSDVEHVIGPIETARIVTNEEGQPMRSPGMLSRHYAPRAPLSLVDTECDELMIELLNQGKKVGMLGLGAMGERNDVMRVSMPPTANGYAASLYAALHRLEGAGVDHVVVVRPPTSEEWQAIHDRLCRASTGE